VKLKGKELSKKRGSELQERKEAVRGSRDAVRGSRDAVRGNTEAISSREKKLVRFFGGRGKARSGFFCSYEKRTVFDAD
jgi:hypothetical protein